MNISTLINNIITYTITIYGYRPVYTAIKIAKLLNYNSSNVLNYTNTSGG